MRNLVLGAAALAVGSVAAAARERAELVIAGDGVRATSVGGVAGRLRIDPAAPGMPTLNPDYARRAGLKSGPFGAGYAVGPVRVAGLTAVARIDLGRGVVKRRVTWTARPYVSDADAAVGPGGLPDPVVRFQLRPARAGERVAALPMAGNGLIGGWGMSMAVAQVDGGPVRVRFDPRRPTVATAGAGVAIARAGGGVLEGAASATEIAFGVERPVRRMRLSRPVAVGPLALDALLVRVSDYGSAASISDANAAPPDPDEVVVTAKGKRNRANDLLILGRDHLARCSSITFDKRAKQIRLSCL